MFFPFSFFFFKLRRSFLHVTPYPFARLTRYTPSAPPPPLEGYALDKPSTSLASNSSKLGRREREVLGFSDTRRRRKGQENIECLKGSPFPPRSFPVLEPWWRKFPFSPSFPPPPQFRPRNYPPVFNFRDEPRP